MGIASSAHNHDYQRIGTADLIRDGNLEPETAALIEEYRQTGDRKILCDAVIKDSHRRQKVIIEQFQKIDPEDIALKRQAIQTVLKSIKLEEMARREFPRQ